MAFPERLALDIKNTKTAQVLDFALSSGEMPLGKSKSYHLWILLRSAELGGKVN